MKSLKSPMCIKVYVAFPCTMNQSKHGSGLSSRCQAYGFIEVFSGVGWASKMMRANGVPTASFDITYGAPLEGKQDAMDILSDPGFSLFGQYFGQLIFGCVSCASVNPNPRNYCDIIIFYLLPSNC